MATTYTLDTGDKVTPENKGGPRVGIGCRAVVSRPSDGPIGVEILRGDGDPTEEAFTYSVRSMWREAEAGVPITVKLGTKDLPAFLPDFSPRSYRLRISSGDGEDIDVTEAFIATEPYAPAGML